MRCSWPNSSSEAPERSDDRLHTRPYYAHAICESTPPPTTIRKCLDRGALQPGVVIPSRVLLTAARRHRPKAQKLHRARVDTGMFDRATCTAALVPFWGETPTPPSPFLETRDRQGNPRCGIGGGAASAAAAAQAGSLLPPMQPLVGGSDAPPPPASAQPQQAHPGSSPRTALPGSRSLCTLHHARHLPPVRKHMHHMSAPPDACLQSVRACPAHLGRPPAHPSRRSKTEIQ